MSFKNSNPRQADTHGRSAVFGLALNAAWAAPRTARSAGPASSPSSADAPGSALQAALLEMWPGIAPNPACGLLSRPSIPRLKQPFHQDTSRFSWNAMPAVSGDRAKWGRSAQLPSARRPDRRPLGQGSDAAVGQRRATCGPRPACSPSFPPSSSLPVLLRG